MGMTRARIIRSTTAPAAAAALVVVVLLICRCSSTASAFQSPAPPRRQITPAQRDFFGIVVVQEEEEQVPPGSGSVVVHHHHQQITPAQRDFFGILDEEQEPPGSGSGSGSVVVHHHHQQQQQGTMVDEIASEMVDSSRRTFVDEQLRRERMMQWNDDWRDWRHRGPPPGRRPPTTTTKDDDATMISSSAMISSAKTTTTTTTRREEWAGASYSSSSSTASTADAIAEEMVDDSRRTIVDEQQMQMRRRRWGDDNELRRNWRYQGPTTTRASSSHHDAVEQHRDEDDDPPPPDDYMQFTNYLRMLEDRLTEDETEEYLRMLDAAGRLVGKGMMMAEESDDDRAVADAATPDLAAPPPSPSTTTEKSSAAEEVEDDKFLRMVSTEVSYKKFLMNQSPYSVTDIEWRVLVQRFLDNVEDSTQKYNGKFKGESKLRGAAGPREGRKTIVVLGTGWAAHAFVKLASTYDLRVVVVSPVNHFVFTPMLASAAVGTVEYRSMTEPIRVTNPYIDNFVEGRAIGVDVANRRLQVQLTSMSTVTGSFKGMASEAPNRLDPEPVLTRIVYGDDGAPVRDVGSMGASDVIELSYDHLICAVGTASRSQIVRGAKEHCFSLKTSQDSKRLRTAIGEALEYASRPDVQEYYHPEGPMREWAREERRRRVRVAVVGGGPTGVELCGELSDFFGQVCRSPDGAYQHLREDVSVTLVHGGPDLLPSMDHELRVRALEALLSQGVEVRLNTRLNEVGRDYIKIKGKGDGVAEETIPLAITIWAAGNAPVPFVGELLSQLPKEAAGPGGRINVDRWLRCPTPTPESFGSVLVLGDAMCLEKQNKFDTSPEPLPQTAQVAGQQGAFVARMLNRGYDLSRSTPPALPEETSDSGLLRAWLVARGLEEAPGFDFLSLGLLAYVGQEEALNQVMVGDVPLFNYSGKIAFALWRTVYLTKQASTRNQALIAFDWLRTETFGRDITRL